MKQNKTIFFLLLAMCFMSSGCNDKSQMLVNTWVVQDLKYTAEVPADLKPTIDRSINEIREFYRLTYYADGTYSTIMKSDTMIGKWKLNWNSSALTTTDSSGAKGNFKIIELIKDKFVFEVSEEKDKVTFVMVSAKPL